MPPPQIPEFVMALLHSSVVHQVASATFQQQSNAVASPTSSSSANNNNNNDKQQSIPPLICTSVDKATEFYHRLETLGFTIGLRVAERLLCGTAGNNNSNVTNAPHFDRPQDEAIHLLRTVLWPALFGKEIVRENDPAAAVNVANKSAAGGDAAAINLTYKLLDTDFSWTKSTALPPDSPSLADPFIRGAQHDILEDAAAFAAGVITTSINKSKNTQNTSNSDQQQQKTSCSNNNNNNNNNTLSTGPNDYVVLLTGMILGFLSSLGFGSHAERRVFGGDRCSIVAQTASMMTMMNINNSNSSATGTPSNKTNSNAIGPATAGGGNVIARPPTSFVTVRHRLLSREGEPVRPSGMHLKLVLHFS